MRKMLLLGVLAVGLLVTGAPAEVGKVAVYVAPGPHVVADDNGGE